MSLIIPNLPTGPLIDKATNEMTPQWMFWFQQLILQLQGSFSNEGVIIPQQTFNPIPPNPSNIKTIFSGVKQPSAGILYGSDTNKYYVNVAGQTFSINLTGPL